MRIAGLTLAFLLPACGGGAGAGLYTVSGTVTGLAGTLVVQNNGGDPLQVASDGQFTFPAAIADGAGYQVTVREQPTGQTCTVVNGTGRVSGANVTNVAVTCNALAYRVGGTLSGLAPHTTVVLQNNHADDLTLGSNGSFAFASEVAFGASYEVTVLTHPAGRSCSVGHGTGIMGAGDVGDVAVTCAADTYTVGGAATGVTGTVTVQNNGGDDLNLSTNGSFTFPTALHDGAAYAVIVSSQPAGLACAVDRATGTIAGRHVTDVAVDCGPACGNGAPDTGEACDDGNAVDETACAYGTANCVACNATCSALLHLTGGYCGDAATNGPEACDDGNTIEESACAYGVGNCVACNATCSAALDLTGAYCGDGTRNGPEACDDGNTVEETACAYGVGNCVACNATCSTALTLTGAYCGDGTRNGPEACDDGNTADEASCPYGTASCAVCNSTCSAQLELIGAYCGDTVVNGAEACDDGNTINEISCAYGTGDCVACNATCSASVNLTGPYCGDGAVSHGEVCDDGNNTEGDSCNNSCSGP